MFSSLLRNEEQTLFSPCESFQGYKTSEKIFEQKKTLKNIIWLTFEQKNILTIFKQEQRATEHEHKKKTKKAWKIQNTCAKKTFETHRFDQTNMWWVNFAV